MTRTKALADVHRRLAENAGPVVAARNLEVAALLDRLHAIESATPEEVGQIERLHSAKLTRLLIEAGPVIAKEADRDRATLLAIVQRQAGEIAELRAMPALSMDAQLSAALSAARAEVERLKVALKNHTPELRAALAREETAHLATLAELDEVRAEWAAEVERLKTANQALAAENARLVNEVGDADQKLAQIRERVRRWEDQEDGATDNMEDIARIVRDLL